MNCDNVQIGWADYARAESFLGWNAAKLIYRAEVKPEWIEDTDRFWYRIRTKEGYEFIKVDPDRGLREPAFDHVSLAASLSRASGTYYVGIDLPFSEITFVQDETKIRFDVEDESWECDLSTYECARTDREEAEKLIELKSPDEAWVAYADGHNLKVRNLDSQDEKALTDDGFEEYGYGTPVMTPLIEAGLADPEYVQFPIAELLPSAIWSPDSRKIITHRLDEREVGKYHLVQSVSLNGDTRQRHFSFTYPLPGDDAVPRAELVILDVETGERIGVDVPPLDVLFFGSPLRRERGEMKSENVWWSEKVDKVYVLRRGRGNFTLALYEVNAATGDSRLVVEETSKTPIDPHVTSSGGTNVRIVDDGELIIWFSQRDGWGHLYLFDGKTGELAVQLTSGPWAVAAIQHVDTTNRMVYFTAVGREQERDPYAEYLYRVSFNGGESELLTPEHANHSITFTPSGAYFVDTYSRLDMPPVTVVRKANGDTAVELEEANIDTLLATGWRPPERFSAKARDGHTDVYGAIFRPSNFDPDKRYPVLDHIYAGPQVNQAPVAFADVARGRRSNNFWHSQALAELGFIVVMLDGLGMPYRSKANHDFSYRNVGDSGLEDHIAALRQMAVKYPYMDLDRVGIFGHSGGGYASCNAMFSFPNFFKVAVSSAGNHDDSIYAAGWTERYQGYPVGEEYVTQANKTNAHKLKGKLLLVHGEMDENVHPASTLVVVDALIKANKDFDMLVMPNQIHSCTNDPYFIRKRWDYFVTHLHGVEPVSGYQVTATEPKRISPEEI